MWHLSTRFGLGAGFHSLGSRLAVAATSFMLLFVASAPAHASDQAGTVTKIAYAGGRYLFWISGSKIGSVPSCDCCGRYEITVNDNVGQALMSLIITAYGSGRSIYVSGSNGCVGNANDTEGVGYMEAR